MLCKINLTTALIVSIGIMLTLCLLREVYFFPMMDMIPNPDTSWLIYAAGRVIDGEKLYIDIMETNPPLIIWISMLPVILARALDVPPLILFPLLIALLSLFSLWLTTGLMRNDTFLSQKRVFYPLVLYIAFGFFLLTPAIYGQREMLLIVLVLPYLFRSLCEEYKPNILWDCIIIAMAAVGFAIKPFFLLLWGMNELFNVFQKRSLRPIFAWHNWMIGFIQLAYLASVIHVTPEYINTIVPVVLATYFTYESQWIHIAKLIGKVCGLTVILYCLARPHMEYAIPTRRMLVWVLAAAGFIILQRKEWINHLYPLIFMAGITITIMLVCMIEIWEDVGLAIGHGRFSALCISVVTLLGCTWVDAKFWQFIYEHPSVIHGKLLKEINERADGKYIYPITFNLQSSFPTIALSKGVFGGASIIYGLWQG